MEVAAQNPSKNPPTDLQNAVQSKDETSNLDPKDRLRRSQRKIEQLQQNLRTKVNLATVESYKQRLNVPTKISYFRDLNENVALKSFDEEFLSRHNLEKDLKIHEKDEVKPRYSKTVSDLEKRWSGKFLDLKRNSSESSKSSYVEEIESLSSIEDSTVAKNLEVKLEEVKKDDNVTASTIDSTSCIEDKLGAVEEEIEQIQIENSRPNSLGDVAIQISEKNPNLEVVSSQKNAYANFLQEFTMDQNAKCQKKEEEKKKKKSGLRRLLPGLFSPKESRKDYKENRERRKRDERYFCRYQQNGNYTMSPDSMNLNDDISRNIPLDKMNSERKQELYVNHRGPSTPEHNSQLRHVFEESYSVSPRLQTPVTHYDEALIDQNMMNRSSDGKKPRQHGWRQYEDKKCNLERKHSLQEQNQARFVRNHVPSGRISAPPSERFLIRPRAVHPVERPLPAIPQRLEFSYENQEKVNVQLGMYDHSRLQNQRMVSFSKYSPSSSQRSGDYDDSNYTPNSSQKSEFSPGSSKSGEYYLGSSRTSNCTSPSCFDKIEQIYDVEEGETSPVVLVHSVPDRIYDETPRNVEMQIVDMNLEPEDEDRNKTLIKTCVDVEVQKEVPESNKSETENQSWKEESPRRITSPLTIIAPENGIFGTRRGSTPTSPVRRAQPGDQILIASPKRALFESQERCGSSPSTTNSPIPIADSPSQMLDSKQAYLKPTISKRVDYKTGGKNQREVELEMARRRYNGSQSSKSPSPRCYQDQQDYLKHDQIYARRTPEPRPVPKQSSPSKKETMQHLEAFYWQQKALEAQKKSPQVRAPERRVPEVIYWQRLKKMDEEQQRKIYQQNMGRHESAPNLVMQQYRQVNYEQVYWKNEVRVPVGKPPIMTPKGQNQPVLVVRPQPAMQDAMNKFVRNGERRSLSLPRRPEPDRVQRSPKSFEERTLPPIFKRGSLVSNGGQVEYGTMGTKRVSFSSPEQNKMDERKWPTKRGMAVEPPTRKHRTEESDGDGGNEKQGFDSPEYANKPLPPPPESLYASKNQQKRWPTESESGSEGGEVQTILQRAENGKVG